MYSGWHEWGWLLDSGSCLWSKREGHTQYKRRNEVVTDCDLPLDLELFERIESDDETLLYVEEDWNGQEQTENHKWVEPDFSLTMEQEGKRQQEVQSVRWGFCRRHNCTRRHNGITIRSRWDISLAGHRPGRIYRDRLNRRSIRNGNWVRAWIGVIAWARVDKFASARMAPWSARRSKGDSPYNSGCRSAQHQVYQSRQHWVQLGRSRWTIVSSRIQPRSAR